MKSILNTVIKNKKDDLPLLFLKDDVIFPNTEKSLSFIETFNISAIEASLIEGRILAVAYSERDDFTIQKVIKTEKFQIKRDNFKEIASLVKVANVLKTPSNTLKVILEGLEAVKIDDIVKKQNYFRAKLSFLENKFELKEELISYMKILKKSFKIYYKFKNVVFDKNSETLYKEIDDIDNPLILVGKIVNETDFSYDLKLEIFQERDLTKKMEILAVNLNIEINLFELQKDINLQVKNKIDKAQKDYFLNEQLREIQKRLGREENDYLEKAKSKNLPENVYKIIEKEALKLSKMQTHSPDANIIRNYIELILDLPWNERASSNNSLEYMENLLNSSHYGMEEAKESIINFLAIYKINPKIKAPIICLVGPPGTGKTSIAESISKALSRNFIKISLGGVRDEAEIRGHRKTYVGALPGVFINAIKRAGQINPVILLDEIDKISNSYKGNPESALLEVLDSEHNFSFVDHYLEIPYDLSNVFFIATANYIQDISFPLLDRMEIIKIEGYSYIEKLHIAKRYLLPNILRDNGLDKVYIKIDDAVLLYIIENYTMESGVRSLKRFLVKLIRKLARELLKNFSLEEIRNGNYYYPLSLIHNNNNIFTHDPDIGGIYKFITMSNLYKYIEDDIKPKLIKISSSGFVYGLAWTNYGGTVLPVEAVKFERKGDILLTGRLGEVMRESAQLAYSVVKNYFKKLNLKIDLNKTPEIHLHFPEGATPKDGPSAGITIAVAIASILSNKTIPLNLAMTGELTLKGKILGVGGIKEKVLAAARNNIDNLILPVDNMRDYKKLPQEVKDKINVSFVSDLDEVFTLLNLIEN